MNHDEHSSPSYHRLLARQLKKARNNSGDVDVSKLLELVNASYGELEHNARMMERAMQHASDEMREQHEVIRKEKQRAEDANFAKNDYISSVSHELRTPMHAVLNYTMMGLKQEVVQQSEKLSKYLTNISVASKRVLDLLDNLLDLAQMESGKVEYQLAMNDVDESLTQALDDLSTLVKARNITVQIRRLTADNFVLCDAKMVRHVFQNILHNALRVTKEYGSVTITLEKTASDAGEPVMRCSVQDQGAGIAPEDLDKVFGKFYQNRLLDKEHRGTGISLAICKEIIAKHHGTIWAELNVDGGANFIFELPLRVSTH